MKLFRSTNINVKDNVDYALISYYLAKNWKKRRISFESKVLNYNSLLYYFYIYPNYANILSIQYS